MFSHQFARSGDIACFPHHFKPRPFKQTAELAAKGFLVINNQYTGHGHLMVGIEQKRFSFKLNRSV
jgi:hypothetical protein